MVCLQYVALFRPTAALHTVPQLFAGRRPFADLDQNEVRRLVLEGKRLETPELLKNQGPKMVKVYEECLSSDWWNRPSMEDVVVKLTPTALYERTTRAHVSYRSAGVTESYLG